MPATTPGIAAPIAVRLACALSILLAGTPLHAQRAPVVDSALVRAVLLAEDRRDSASAALARAMRSSDPRVRMLARRARARIVDPTFAARDSLLHVAAAPVYADPAWRLRYRALTNRTSCDTLARALSDSAWAVRLRATDLLRPECGQARNVVRTLTDWVDAAPANARRARAGVSWHAAGHAIVALARIARSDATPRFAEVAASRVPWLRAYAARAAAQMNDTTALRRLAHDPDDNVKEAAIDGLARVAAHAADDDYLSALGAPGYQAVRAAARALAGSPRGGEVLRAAVAAAYRLRSDSSETSRDTRLALLGRIAEFAPTAAAPDIIPLTVDFDCAIADSAAAIAARIAAPRGPRAGRCTPLPVQLPADAASLALGREVRLRVVMADSSGGGTFTVRLRGDVAPIMAARILALARAGYYNGLTWHRVEPDFVIQGGSPGANEYIGNPRYLRDELGTIPHPRGTVGMSTRGHDTGDAQWFVNLRDNARLERDYTVFGEVTDGIDVVDGILEGDVIARVEEVRP
jgi:cyclophilin family peptidyl-prolyl cis-trans isomerase